MERVGRPTLLHTQVVLPQLTQAALYTHASVRSALEGCRPDSTNLAAAPCRRGQVAPSLRGRGDLRQSQHAAHAACIGRQYVSAAVVHLPGQVRSGQWVGCEGVCAGTAAGEVAEELMRRAFSNCMAAS